MQARTHLIFTALLVLGASAHVLAAGDDGMSPIPGEVRRLAISATNTRVISRLHHDGWLEARGQLLSTAEFPDLFEAIGRTWTSNRVPEGCFAVPDVRDRTWRESSDNPFGVLGPGDLLANRFVDRRWSRPAPLSYWIFVGRDLTGTHPQNARQ